MVKAILRSSPSRRDALASAPSCLRREGTSRAFSGRSRVYNLVRARSWRSLLGPRVSGGIGEYSREHRRGEEGGEAGRVENTRDGQDRGRTMMVCAAAYKNREGNPGTRPTAYYLRHRNARPCDRPMMLERTCVSARVPFSPLRGSLRSYPIVLPELFRLLRRIGTLRV